MKTFAKLFIVVFAIAGATSLSAQDRRGGMGFFEAGVDIPFSSKVETRLQNVGLLGANFLFDSPGLHFGGRGFGMFNRFMIGGGGYATTMSGTNNAGEATLSVGAGFFNFGYKFVDRERTLAYVFGGVGGGGGNLRVKNTGGVTMAFAANQQIPSGENRLVNGGGFGFEAGLGINQLIIRNDDEEGGYGGFMLGLIAGINYFPSGTWKFEANETNVTGLGNLSSFYVGITIGGGGFENK